MGGFKHGHVGARRSGRVATGGRHLRYAFLGARGGGQDCPAGATHQRHTSVARSWRILRHFGLLQLATSSRPIGPRASISQRSGFCRSRIPMATTLVGYPSIPTRRRHQPAQSLRDTSDVSSSSTTHTATSPFARSRPCCCSPPTATMIFSYSVPSWASGWCSCWMTNRKPAPSFASPGCRPRSHLKTRYRPSLI